MKVQNGVQEQQVLDMFVLHFHDDTTGTKLYFKIKIIWLTKKNLIKIVIMDEIAKKSNSVIEKMPATVHQRKSSFHMAQEIKSMVSLISS